jgi:hypothetical protein
MSEIMTGGTAMPGFAIQSPKHPSAQKSVKKPIQGLRGPAASAIAPRSGLESAMMMPAIAWV